MRATVALALLLLAGGPMPASAQDARVRAAVDDDGTLWAGQQVTLNLDLMTNGTSFSDVHFNLPEVAGAFLMRIDSNTIKRTERIDGESWQVIRYPLALFPQASGPIEVPAIDVRFAVTERFGEPAKPFRFATEPVVFEVAWPPGAPEGGLVVTTRDFEVEHAWEGADEALVAGGAVTLTVTRRAADISAMLLPPLPVYEAPGLAAYPSAPDVADQSARGALTGVRTDRITWVVEQVGRHEIPGVRFAWWDPSAERLRERVVSGVALEAVPGPASDRTLAPPPPRSAAAWWWALAVLVGGATLGAAYAARAHLARILARAGRTARAAWRRILPPRRALLPTINPGPES